MTKQLYHLANIRDLLINGFDDRDLRRLCHDDPEFRPVYDRLARTTGKADIVDELIEHAEKHLLLDTLLARAKEHSPDRYEHHRPYLVDFTSVEASLNWEAALEKYRERIADLYGTTQIFGQPEPVPLGDIYTDLYLLEKPSAFRHLGIHQLRQDPDLLKGSQRIRGSVLLREPKAHRLFILGKPGAGKTTFLKHIALEAAQGKLDRVPVFVTFKEWADTGEDLLPFIARQFALCGFPDSLPYIQHLLQHTDDALVLFDGLDEVQQETGARDHAIRALRDFGRQYSRAQCLVTCRTAATDHTFEGFAYAEVADFTEEQMETFVRKWFHATPFKAGAFLAEIAKEQHRGLRELACIPLLLSLLCLTFEDTLSFPGGRAGVYSHALDVLLRQWDTSRLVRRDEIYRRLSLERKHQLFASIAAQTFEDDVYFVPQHQLESMISRYLATLPGADAADMDAYAVLKAIEAQHGILFERANGIYSFAHLCFQEYYTARHILENTEAGTLEVLVSRADYGKWWEVFLLTASRLPDATRFLALFEEVLRDLVVRRPRLAGWLRWIEQRAAASQAAFRQSETRLYYASARQIDRSRATISPILAQLSRITGRPPLFPPAISSTASASDSLSFDDSLGDLGRSVARSFTFIRARNLARDLDFDLEFDLSLSASEAPAADAPPETRERVSGQLQTEIEGQSTLERYRQLRAEVLELYDEYEKQSSKLDAEDYRWLSTYLQGTGLFYQCLQLAYTPDHERFEERILAPPP